MRTAPATLLFAMLAAATGVALSPARPAAQEPPVFRADIDVIRLDVTVVDRDRRPVRGLTAADFTVTEDGQRQRIVAVTEIQASENDPVLAPRMRYVPRDVAANDVVDRLGDGRVFTLVLDDFNIPFDDEAMARATREAARYVIDRLGPSDVASVVFVHDAGNTVDFTDDRARLLAAIDAFTPRERYPGYTPPTPRGPGPWGGDMAQRFAPVLMRTQCMRSQPLVPTLDTVALRLTPIPNRRKTVIVLSTGMTLNFGATSGCQGELAGAMREAFRTASRANINIYGVDPAGYRGYEDYLQHPLRNTRIGMRSADPREAADQARRAREFLQTTADNTGGRAIVATDAIEHGLDEMFAEDGSYYLVGYQSSNTRADGRFRSVNVSVRPPGATARTRSGYFAPRPGTLAATPAPRAGAANEFALSGLGNPVGVALRAASTAVGLAAPGTSRDGLAAFTLAVRYPASAGTVAETLTVTRSVYDIDGNAGTPVQEKLALTLDAAGMDGQRRELFYGLRLPPGRHQVRFEVHSTALDRSGSVIAEVEIPDFSRARLTLSGIVLGSRADDELPAALRDALPVVPTADRDFAAAAAPVAFVRIYQAGAPAPAAVTVKAEIVDVRDRTVFQTAGTLAVDAFDAAQSATFETPLPFADLERGPYVLSISAESPGAPAVRRDLLFRIR